MHDQIINYFLYPLSRSAFSSIAETLRQTEKRKLTKRYLAFIEQELEPMICLRSLVQSLLLLLVARSGFLLDYQSLAQNPRLVYGLGKHLDLPLPDQGCS